MHPQEDPKVLSGRIYNIEHFWGSDEYTKTTKVMAEHNTSVAEYREKSKGVTLIHLMNLWLIGVKNDNVPPLGILDTQSVKHFDNNARQYSTFKQAMVVVERFGRERGVWLEDRKNWDGKSVTALWSAIWHDMYPYMSTKTTKVLEDPNNPDMLVQSVSYNKSRTGQISVRSVCNKLCGAGMFGEGNRVRKRQKTT